MENFHAEKIEVGPPRRGRGDPGRRREGCGGPRASGGGAGARCLRGAAYLGRGGLHGRAAPMAALGDEGLDGYMYPACAPCSYPIPYLPAAKGKGAAGGADWRHRGGSYPPASSSSSSSSAGAAPAALPGCGQLAAADYFDSYQRAQLMALLSQVSPSLAPALRRAGGRDVAVQVNPRRDVSVQCSLGRRTLPRRARDPGSPAGPGPGPLPEGAGGGSASPQPARQGPGRGSPPSSAPRPVRFPRTVAVYSPVASRRLTTLLEGAGGAAGERGPPSPRPRGPEAGETSVRTAPQQPQPQDEEEEDEAQGAGSGLPPREAPGGEAAPGRAPSSLEQPPPGGMAQAATGERPSLRSPEPGKERLRFQVSPSRAGGLAGAGEPGARRPRSLGCPRPPPLRARGGAGLPWGGPRRSRSGFRSRRKASVGCLLFAVLYSESCF